MVPTWILIATLPVSTYAQARQYPLEYTHYFSRVSLVSRVVKNFTATVCRIACRTPQEIGESREAAGPAFTLRLKSKYECAGVWP